MTITKLGDMGIEVRKIQLLLNSNLKPSPKLTVDGDFGQGTLKAVKAFQTQAGLEPDGEVGPATRKALSVKPEATPVAPLVVSSGNNWMDIATAELGIREDSWLNCARAVTDPVAGDVIVIKKKTPGMTQATGSSTGFHVGFFVSQNATSVRILGGNQSDSVKYSNFPLSTYAIKGYRRP